MGRNCPRRCRGLPDGRSRHCSVNMANDNEASKNPPVPSSGGRARAAISEAPPAQLSDLAVSPFGMPTALLKGEVRVAWLGRTSTEDQQDPRQSLIRQLHTSKSAIPASWAIVCHFYDVESGRLELDARGRKTGYERFDIPIARDGGITDLLEEASHPNRRFDVVICENASRTARRMYEGLSIERELERANVPLFASNEPIKLDGGRAQQILQRRINQSVAEYEVLNTLELSWGGLCTHVREGWNIGKPPYGYAAKRYKHPNPLKAAKGATKTRLEPDGRRAETVTTIANWRYYEDLGYDTIVERLNADLDLYPPPEPPGGPARARGAWSKSTVCDLLRNPKYTGYQVFNRRGTRSRGGAYNDPRLWVWSPEPAHEPLIPKWMYDELAARRAAKRGSRDKNTPNAHPDTRRTYLFRGRVHCFCHRRMRGLVQKRLTYYQCWPKGNNRGRPQAFADHPKTVYIRETALIDAVSAFFADRVFGPQRRELFAADLASQDDRAARQREDERERLRHTLADVQRRQANILRQVEESDPGDSFARGLRDRYNDLERERQTTLAAVSALDAADTAEPARPTADTVDLLNALPYLEMNLALAPEPLLRQLFELTQLTIELHDDSDHITLTIRLPADYVPRAADTAERITDAMPHHTRRARKKSRGGVVHAVGAAQGAR
ncbi:recombinase family protein [Streptomyces sp. NPDC001401]|uniref:recombinase family protein n=1 Tax=Streptomyces sp. NPDC001401 TaxID=3364570 RepID=UPI00367E21D5